MQYCKEEMYLGPLKNIPKGNSKSHLHPRRNFLGEVQFINSKECTKMGLGGNSVILSLHPVQDYFLIPDRYLSTKHMLNDP